ncbi:hypothetical protein ACHAQA_007852 [Verticillium albo-atrum]
MAPPTFVFLLVCLLFSSSVLAGSSVWQPTLVRTSSLVDKRYYYVNSDTQVTDRVPWENRLIRYCFSPDAETQAAKSMLKKYLKDARKVWIAKGLDSNFRIEEVNDDVCTNDRNSVLMVYYTGPTGGMATYVGFPGAGVVMLKSQGPSMRLTDRTDMGLLDVVANFAHELGHAWGLYHEHQNPKFWAGVEGSDSGEVFGPGNPGGWNCHNLLDYNSVVTGLVVQTGNGGNRNLNRERLCSNYGVALNARFSACDYLPMPNVGTAHSNGHGANDVDWESLMIYPSGAGGVATGTGAITKDNDHRAPILLKPDGSRIDIKLTPSSLDIAALSAMYKDVEGTKLDVINSLTSFKKVYKTSGSGPTGGSGCL